MQTVTISMRVPEAEASAFSEIAAELGMERPTFLKRALRLGCRDLKIERACQAYRDGEATLSRAAEIAGISLRDMMLKLHDARLELNYGVEDLARDLEA